jgi:hypothetical protein
MSTAKDQIRTAKDQIRTANRGLRTSKDQTRNANRGLWTLKDQMRNANRGLRTSKDQIRNVNRGLRHSKDQMRNANRGLRDVNGGLRSVNRGLRTPNRDLRAANRQSPGRGGRTGSVETPRPFQKTARHPPSVGASQRLWNEAGSLSGIGPEVAFQVETGRPVMVSERIVVSSGPSLRSGVPRLGESSKSDRESGLYLLLSPVPFAAHRTVISLIVRFSSVTGVMRNVVASSGLNRYVAPMNTRS